ncbi:helix-turn-helix transcriptional regulator [Longimicrobium sp.]|uniref:helix-turn-helix domain-containing protein n=1 Tax=Longimicrobium sp. TaxID=2029185 RepID=UPI002CDE4496|nr:helix-turn-helix transcriptional regulator [Longimicrobium sp.]HSU13452.1 helix-turn-helix transcriptional regulator [Longimicrobium sp.]
MTQIDLTPSSGNIFADLGFPDAEELYAKSFLSIVIARTIRERRLSEAEVEKILGTTLPAVQELIRGRLSGFSVEQLSAAAEKLG